MITREREFLQRTSTTWISSAGWLTQQRLSQLSLRPWVARPKLTSMKAEGKSRRGGEEERRMGGWEDGRMGGWEERRS